MDNISELLSSIVSFLVIIVPFYLFIVSRRLIAKRKRDRKDVAEKPDRSEQPLKRQKFPFFQNLFGIQEELHKDIPAPKGHLRAADIVREKTEAISPPVIRAQSYKALSQEQYRRKSSLQALQETDAEEIRESPLEVLRRYPTNQRAVIMAEIIGKPKAFSNSYTHDPL